MAYAFLLKAEKFIQRCVRTRGKILGLTQTPYSITITKIVTIKERANQEWPVRFLAYEIYSSLSIDNYLYNSGLHTTFWAEL